MFNNLELLIETAGYIGVFSMVFAESGILLGAVLPGDTLLFTAGLLASKGYFSITILLIGTFVSAVLGDSVGYWTGKRFGRRLFNREESFFFKKSYVTKAEHYFEKHGKKTIFLARYLPVMRTFSPILAGIAGMEYTSFLTFNVLGALAWTLSITLAGYFLGTHVPNIDKYVLPIVVGIFVISFIPIIKQIFDARRGASTNVK